MRKATIALAALLLACRTAAAGTYDYYYYGGSGGEVDITGYTDYTGYTYQDAVITDYTSDYVYGGSGTLVDGDADTDTDTDSDTDTDTDTDADTDTGGVDTGGIDTGGNKDATVECACSSQSSAGGLAVLVALGLAVLGRRRRD